MMKLFKKFAAVTLAAVLAVSMLAGCSKSYGTPEEEILNKINETRTSMKSGLEPLTNDAELAAAAGKLLDAFAESPAQTNTANGYKLTGQQITTALGSVASGKTVYKTPGNTNASGMFNTGIYVAPITDTNSMYGGYDQISSGSTYYLIRGAAADDIGDYTYNYSQNVMPTGNYGYDLARNNKTKVGIAARTINGKAYVMVVYDVDTNYTN